MRLYYKKWLSLFLLVGIALLSLVVVHQIPARYRLNVVQANVGQILNNFYAPEQNQYRWTTPQAQLHLLPLDSTLQICLNIEEPFPVQRQLELRLVSQTKPFQVFQLQKGLQTYCAVTPTLAGFWPGSYRIYKDDFLYNVWFGQTLELKVEAYQPPGDRRELGILIRNLEIKSAVESGRIGLPTFLEISITLLIVIGSWSLLTSLNYRPLVIIGVSLVSLTSWLGLIAFGRVILANKIEFILYATIATLIALYTAHYVVPNVFQNLVQLRKLIKAGLIPSYAVPLSNKTVGLKVATVISLVILGLGTILSLVAASEPSLLWGFNRTGATIGGVALAGLLLSFVKPNFPNINVYLKLLGLAMVTTLLFYGLHSNNSYGDGNELVSKLNLYLQYRFETNRSDFFVWREREPLDFALHFILWRAMLRFEWWKPEYTYTLTSMLAGGLFVGWANLLARMLTTLMAGRWLITGLLLSSGTILVFCGYIESYTLVTLFALVYTIAGLASLNPKISIAWPAFALITMVLLHPQTIFLVPSFGFLLLWRSSFGHDWQRLGRESLQASLIAATVILAFGMLGIMYNYSWQQWGIASQQFGGSDNGSFKPLLGSAIRNGSREFYPVLSLEHLIYQLNLQMRLAPLGLPLILIAGVSQIKSLPRINWVAWLTLLTGFLLFFGSLTWIGSQAIVPIAMLGLIVQAISLYLIRNQIEPISVFLVSLTSYTLIFSGAWNPDLGSNDWDLLSLNGIFTSLLAGYLMTRSFGLTHQFGRSTKIILICALALQAGWIFYNVFI